MRPGGDTVAAPSGQPAVLFSVHGGQWQQTGNAVTVSGPTLPAGHGVTLRLDGSYYRGGNPLPTAYQLNDGVCMPEVVAAPAGGDEDDDEGEGRAGGGRRGSGG